MLRHLFCVFCVFFASFASAESYLSQNEFLTQTLGEKPAAKVLWLDANLRNKLKADLAYVSSSARVRYWELNHKRAWILDEVGRDEPITMGFVIEDNKITQLRILEFRESRGYEVRYPRFTTQFSTLALDDKHELNQSVDNITGATLSVNTVKKSARLALYLNQQVELNAHKK